MKSNTTATGYMRASTMARSPCSHAPGSIAKAVATLGARQAYLDGKLCGVRADGITSFSMIQMASDAGNAAGLVFFLFDLLYLGGEDLCPRPLIERKARLAALLADTGSPLHPCDHQIGRGRVFHEKACAMSLDAHPPIIGRMGQSCMIFAGIKEALSADCWRWLRITSSSEARRAPPIGRLRRPMPRRKPYGKRTAIFATKVNGDRRGTRSLGSCSSNLRLISLGTTLVCAALISSVITCSSMPNYRNSREAGFMRPTSCKMNCKSLRIFSCFWSRNYRVTPRGTTICFWKPCNKIDLPRGTTPATPGRWYPT